MAKEKKITVKLFPRASTRLKDSYSIYCRVTYDRKSTMFSINHSYRVKDNTKEKTQEYIDKMLDSNEEKTDLFYIKRRIETIVREEIKMFGDKYSIVGFNERSKFYLGMLGPHLTSAMYMQLLEVLQSHLTYKQYVEFEPIIMTGLARTKYFRLFDIIKYLSSTYNITIDRLIDDSFFKFIITVGYFNCFVIHINEKRETERINEVTTKEWFAMYVDVGEWMVNDNSVRDRFRAFIKSGKAKDSLNKYTENDIKELAQKLSFDVLVNDHSAIIMIDAFIRKAQTNFK